LASWVPGDSLRILLISPQEGFRNQVGEALAGLAGDHRLSWVSQADLAFGRAQDLVPHIVLLDDEVLGERTAELVRDLVALVPDTGVILLSSPDATGLARQAVLAGASGFVSKPVNPDDLLAAIRQVLSRRAPIPEVQPEATIGQVVVFCAPKGGTGRTTLAINTSISILQVTRQPVVLVDADYAAPAIDVALNLREQRDISELRHKMSQLDQDLIASILAKHESGLSVLLAPPPAETTAPLTLPQVQQVLVWLRRMFPCVVVDLGLPLDETAFAFLDSADLICMSVLPEMISLRNIRLMLEQLVTRGYPEDRIWLILNRRGLPGGLEQSVLEDWLGRPMRYAIPNDQELATDTVNRGVPFVLGHKRSAVAKASAGLAGEIVRALTAEAETAVPVAAVSAARAAAAPPLYRSSPLKPALMGFMGLLIMLLLVWAGFPAVRRGLLGGTNVPSTPVAEVARATAAGVAAAEIGATPSASLATIVERETEASSAAIVAVETTEAPVNPVAESPTAPTQGPAIPAPANSPVPESTPSQEPAPTVAPTRTATARPTRPSTAAPTPTATAKPTQAPTSLPSPTATRVQASPTATRVQASPTATRVQASPTATRVQAAPIATRVQVAPTATRVQVAPTATRVQAAPTATRISQRPPSPTPVIAMPSLVEPAPAASTSGKVAFQWQPAVPLPSGAAYEVVVWNSGEDPASARGVAATTTGTSLTADLNTLYGAGLLNQGETFWTVLVVQADPYVRLSQPAAAGARTLIYQAPSGGGGGPEEPPPKP
jgi:pilus assembly protein CpaE